MPIIEIYAIFTLILSVVGDQATPINDYFPKQKLYNYWNKWRLFVDNLIVRIESEDD